VSEKGEEPFLSDIFLLGLPLSVVDSMSERSKRLRFSEVYLNFLISHFGFLDKGAKISSTKSPTFTTPGSIPIMSVDMDKKKEKKKWVPEPQFIATLRRQYNNKLKKNDSGEYRGRGWGPFMRFGKLNDKVSERQETKIRPTLLTDEGNDKVVQEVLKKRKKEEDEVESGKRRKRRVLEGVRVEKRGGIVKKILSMEEKEMTEKYLRRVKEEEELSEEEDDPLFDI